MSLSELAALDEDDAPRPIRKRKPASEAIVPVPAPLPVAEFDEVDEPPIGSAPPRGQSDDDSVKTWILRGLMVGVVVVLIGVGLQQLLALSRPTPPETETEGGPTAVETKPGTPSVAEKRAGLGTENDPKDPTQTRARVPGAGAERRLE